METANKGSNCGRNRYVCFGSLAVECGILDVRFTPKSGHAHRGHRCLLCAISGHCAVLDAPASAASQPASPPKGSGQASPRDNVVFEAGLFGGVLGMRRTFILHARGSKLPSDLLGLTSIRYGEATAAEMKVVNQKLRKAIENEGRVARIEGLWWHCSLTALGPWEPSAVSLIRISRDRDGALELHGRCWQEDGKLSARYWSEAVKDRKEPSGIFYYWKGERPRDPNAPQLDGMGEILLESADRAAGYFTTRSDASTNARTAGVHRRVDPEDIVILDGNDDRGRAELIAERLRRWKSIANA